MYNMNYKESEHMKEVRKKYLEKIKEEPAKSLEQINDAVDKLDYSIEEIHDSEQAYTDGYLQGQKDILISSGIGLVFGCIIGAIVNYLNNK